MPIKLKNNVSGFLATAISASDTGLVLQSGNGAAFPTLGASDYFYATLVSTGGTQEVVKVTARVGDTMTVVRAQEGSSAAGFAAGTRIELRVTAQSVLDAARYTEIVSVKDFGAVGDGVADDTAAFTAAGSFAATVQVEIPSGNYNLVSSPTPTGSVTWVISADAQIIGAGKLSERIIQTGGSGYNLGTSLLPATVRGFMSYQSPSGTAILPSEYYNIDFNLFRIFEDKIDCEVGPGPAVKVNGLAVLHDFGGATVTGGRHSMYGKLVMNATTSAASTDRNYVGVQGQSIASANDNGVLGNTKGAVFGASFLAELFASATHFNNISACEFNTGIAAGTAPDYRSGIQIASRDADRGVSIDAMISLSDISSTANGKWLNAILIGNQNSQHPLDPTDGTIVKTRGAATIKDVVDVSSYTVTGALVRGKTFVARENELVMNGVTPSIEMGSKIVGNTPFIDFNSSGNSNDYDVRLLASGGTSSVGNGTLTIVANFAVLPTKVSVLGMPSFANDAAASAGGVLIGQLYRNGNVVQIRVT
jgi:hypothetical protein